MIVERLKEYKIISILRGIPAERVSEVAGALYEGGVRTIEITFNTEGAEQMIREVKARFGDRMIVGAGTVLDAETARTAILAGADFMLSPSLDEGMVRMCCRYGKVAVPGTFTPTEMVKAVECGAQIVKLFPASFAGPGYIRQVRGPLDHIDIMAVGGVSLDNYLDFLRAGACTVGIGSELVNVKTLGAADALCKITDTARRFTSQL
ncbi:MAG TPA: bifunctional 4-hydroxy-2-oxoglutarate aldolase/2-dehydro-3-deoxy-phosphogluconate aldolase [Armatimonadota bacterium]|nr:bifunctional 4-hydroxy-2-oxoglutarate aldolase/2-dehydro-3-deoxy-phosphogluconate aldolase [Armatimonadota bacterium]